MKWFLCLIVGVFSLSAGYGEPPKVEPEFPADVKEAVFIDVTIPKDGTLGWKAAGFTEKECQVREFTNKNPLIVTFAVKPLKEGKYAIVFWTGLDSADSASTVIRVGKEEDPPKVDPGNPPTNPPTKPPAIPPSGLHFIIARPDGPADPALVRLLADPAWAVLKKAGHHYKDKTLTELVPLNIALPTGTRLPCVITLGVLPDNKGSVILRGPVEIKTAEDILKLPDGVQ